jgi:UDP-N-acetyl-D-galactosamine dehydrogenase
MEFNSKIAVIGLGYVGFLARLFATRHVVGFDINQSRVAELKSGIDTTLEIDTTTLQKVLVEKLGHDKGLYCTTALDEIKECNYYIVTVPLR